MDDRSTSLDRAWTATRAQCLPSAQQSHGSVLNADDAVELVSRCASRGAALVVDEVFWDYPLGVPLEDPPALRSPAVSLARLGGLSKSDRSAAGEARVDRARRSARARRRGARSPRADRRHVSLGLDARCRWRRARCLRQARRSARRFSRAIRENDACLRRLAGASSGVDALPADGGWTAVLRVPATRSEEDLVMTLVERDGVVVHPGYFFDFAHEAFLVISLLPEPDVFARGVARILERVDAA
jgi:aspartate/methionine/tyrosine aminotransferase